MLDLEVSPGTTHAGRKTCLASTCQTKFAGFEWICSLIIAVSFLPSTSVFGGAVINEIMYHPASGNVLERYIELRNTDNVATNISGWRFTKGIQFTFPTNTTLEAGAYLIVAADRTAFTNKYPGVLNFVTGWTGAIGHLAAVLSPHDSEVAVVCSARNQSWL